MIQYSTTIRNNQLDQVESTIGSSPKLQLRTGAAPANCAAADSGTLLDEITLPSDWMAAASSGSKSKSGTWTGSGAVAAGVIGHFRIKDSSGTTTHVQGSVSLTGGGGDMIVDSLGVIVSQIITVNVFTIVRGNA
jgi:hypothetical protein